MRNSSWSTELIIQKIHDRVKSGLSLGTSSLEKEDNGLFMAGRRYFGSWENSVVAAGYNYSEYLSKQKWTKQLVELAINDRHKNGLSLSGSDVNKENKSLHSAARTYFGSWGNALISLGFDINQIQKCKPVKYWTTERVVEALGDRLSLGLPMNRNCILKDNGGLLTACLRHFGTYENAIKFMGWEYDNIREDISLMSYYGIKFEKLLGEIFKELGMNYTKGYTNDVIPDFVFDEGEWCDAKLSEWTLFVCDTVNKYEPHCNSLTIIYLRGDKNKVERLTDKTKVMSVYQVISTLPLNKREYYIQKLNDLYKQADQHEEIEIKPIEIKKTSYRGVYWKRDNQKWAAAITHKNKRIYLGVFDTEIDAARMYDQYVLENGFDKVINFGLNPLAIKQKKSKFFGIRWDERINKWVSSIQVNKIRTIIGNFTSEINAAMAYNNYITENGIDRPLNQFTEDELSLISFEYVGRGKSKYLGVSWNSRLKKWKAEATEKEGKRHFVGYFNSEYESVIARNEFIIKNNINSPLNNLSHNAS